MYWCDVAAAQGEAAAEVAAIDLDAVETAGWVLPDLGGFARQVERHMPAVAGMLPAAMVPLAVAQAAHWQLVAAVVKAVGGLVAVGLLGPLWRALPEAWGRLMLWLHLTHHLHTRRMLGRGLML